MLPFRIARSCLEEANLLLRGERPPDRCAAGLRQHLDVVFEPSPLLESLEHLAKCADIHVDRPVARAIQPSLRLESLDGPTRDGGELHVAKEALHRLEPLLVELDRALRVRSRLLRLDVII